MTEEYLDEFESHLVGTSEEKAEWVAELSAHLEEAREAGELGETLARLGSPRDAAAAFRSGRPLVSAPLKRRAMAVGIDAVPLLIAMVAVLVEQIGLHRGVSLIVPPFVSVNIAHGVHWDEVVQPLALLWVVVGLGLIEARYGRTPGKALLGLRTVSEDGTSLTLSQALLRRVSVLGGPFMWLDWLVATDPLHRLLLRFGLRDEHRGQRLLDVAFHTVVVDDPLRARHSGPLPQPVTQL